jgi:hypothetical protein
LRRELTKAKESHSNVLNEKKALDLKFESHVSKFNAEQAEESELKTQRIQELDLYCK